MGDPAVMVEIVDEGQRIHAILHHFLAEAQRKMPMIGGHHGTTGRRLRVGFGRRWFGDSRPNHHRWRVAAQHGLEPGNQFITVRNRHRRIFSHGHDQGGEVILTRQQQRDERTVEMQAALAQTIKDVLDNVRKAHDFIETEKPARSLDGMRTTEQGIEIFVGTRPCFGTQQDIFHLGEQFARLIHKGSAGLREIERGIGHGHRLQDSTAAVNNSGSPSAPPKLARSTRRRTTGG